MSELIKSVHKRHNDDDKRVTLQEISDITKAAYRTVAAYAQRAGWTENGKQTLLTEKQATVIIEAMKDGAKANHSNTLLSSMQGVNTSLSRVLQLENLQKQMQEIYDAEISDLRAANQALLPKAEYFDELVSRNLLTSFRTTAKELKVRETDFIKFLLNKKFVYRNKSGSLEPYADKNNELFEVKECVSPNNTWRGTQTLVTPKGRETFRLLFAKTKAA